MKERINKYVIALLSVMMVCLLAVPATANYSANGWVPTTRTNGTINGTVFIDSVAWNGQTTLTLNTAVPNGTVKWAYLYTGVWGGTETYAGWVNVTFNGNYTANGLGPIHLQGENDNNDNVWCTGHGKYWWWYNVTNLTNAGQTNTAVTSKINGSLDGRVYGTVLVVVLEDDNLSAIRYWINDGSDALQSGHDNGTTNFNGSVDNDNVTTSALTVVHLTGYYPGCNNCLDFNDHPLNTSEVDSNNFELNTWNNGNSNVTPENVTSVGNHADYRRDEDGYVNVCNAILVLNDTAIDLTVDDIDIDTPRPNTNFTVNATIKNWGSNGTGGHFNVSLRVDGVLNGTVNVTSGLSGGSSTTVSFEDVNLPKGCYEFKVFADCDNDITNESIETNNNLTVNGQVGYVIVVEKNSDFEKLNTSGSAALPSGCFKNESGTYYIQNLTIENCNGNGITIRNTDATFVINNCTIKNCTGSGVFLHDLKNGTINGSDILNNTKYGIEVGLVPLDSNDPEFVDITNNTINGTKTYNGIDLVGFNCTVKNNIISNSTVYGIYLFANDTDITNGNKIRDNGDYGVKLYNSSRNNVHCNTFIDNNISGHQAWDNGNTNNWNSTDADDDYIGNRWKDWKDNSGYPCNYTIDGGSNVDKRPKGFYDFLTGAGEDKWAFKDEVSANPPDGNSVPDVEFLSAEYGYIEADDEDEQIDDSDSNGNYAAHRFNFSISEDPDDISEINVTWNGKGWHDSAANGTYLYIWNGTGYEELANNSDDGDWVYLTGVNATAASNYVNGGNVTVLVVQKSPQTRGGKYSHIATDYVRLVIADP